ncbi:uncharacterized protein LOC130950215 [Arachis stenosperma]|uniref:uncharacterized protein LOC130950215 n=1 Tax=Arachis stenosperma TaxID=217475 RepID=UPI0025AC543E|nr:uncharacterized protein LOC130950215 [Arachis stenosperma]
MADNGIQQTTPAELMTMMAVLQAEVRKIVEQSSKNPGGSSTHARGTEPLEITLPKEKLTLDNPFLEGVMSVYMPKNFVLPTELKPYEGFGDPRIHIKKFQSMMFFNGAFDPVLCQTFPTYLDGIALLWFSKIPAGSISCFEDLARSFIDYFAASRIYVHGSNYLSTIKQGQHESLKDYMTRFTKKATMEIPDLDPKVHLRALKSSLRPGKFQETIAVTKPRTLEEFREMAAGQMEIKELREARRADKPQPWREEEKYPKTPSHKDNKKPFKLTPKYDSYTKFNTRREDIIKEILNAKIIKPPSRKKARIKIRDTSTNRNTVPSIKNSATQPTSA